MSFLAVFHLLLALALSETQDGIAHGSKLEPQWDRGEFLNFSCNSPDSLSFFWNLHLTQSYKCKIGIYKVPNPNGAPDPVTDCRSSNPTNCFLQLGSAQMLHPQGQGSFPLGDTEDQIWLVATCFDHQNWYLGYYQPMLTNCRPSPSDKPHQLGTTLGISLPIAIGVAFIIFVGTVRAILGRKKEENGFVELSTTTDDSSPPETPDTTWPATEGGYSVQIFPNHPMMQTQTYQDPLSTLTPVYTATYVPPGVQ